MGEIVKEFLTEARENLDRLDLESSRLGSDGWGEESLAIMVRSVHTIKGAAGFLGFPHIERVTRAGECLLVRLRDGKVSCTAEIASEVAVLSGAVRHMLEEIESTGRDGDNDYPNLLATLNRLSQAAAAAAG